MRLHPLKYDFLKRNFLNKEIISAKKEELNINNVVPLFYIERNEQRHYFGNIYKFDETYYFLLPMKFDRNSDFDKDKAFYGYKMCKMFVDESSVNKFQFHGDISSLTTEFDYQKNMLFNIFDNGEYLGNLYLHDIKDIVKEIRNQFKEYTTKPKIEKILSNYSQYNNSTYGEVMAGIVNNVHLYFNPEVLNLNKYSDWKKLFDYKNRNFQVKVQLENWYKFRTERNLNDLYEENNLNYGSYETDDWVKFTSNLRTGSFVVGQYCSKKLLKDLNNLSKNNLLTFNINTFQPISFSSKEIIEHINYYKELIVIIDESGYPALKSIHHYNDDKYTYNLNRPFVNLDGMYYKVINDTKKERKIYNENILKLI